MKLSAIDRFAIPDLYELQLIRVMSHNEHNRFSVHCSAKTVCIFLTIKNIPRNFRRHRQLVIFTITIKHRVSNGTR